MNAHMVLQSKMASESLKLSMNGLTAKGTDIRETYQATNVRHRGIVGRLSAFQNRFNSWQDQEF